MKELPAKPEHKELIEQAFKAEREIRPKYHVSYLAQPAVSDFHCQRILQSMQSQEQESGLQLFLHNNHVKAIAAFSPSEWHRSVFNVSYNKIQSFYCFSPIHEEVQSIVQGLISMIKDSGEGVYTTRIETHQANLIYEMVRAGFIPVGTSIRMVHSFETKPRIDKDFSIQYDNLTLRDFEPRDLEPVQQIGRCGHTHSHFYCETRFSPSQVQRLFAEWIEKCVNGLAKKVLVAEKEGRIAGFATLLTSSSLMPYIKKRIGVIDFIVVDPEFQGCGVGKALLQASFAWFASQVDLIELRTMADNLTAIRFYENNGFRMLSSDQHLHYWNENL